ncbi:MAG: hypothetical protein AMXMBFR64_42510 [Myxococcales bacterium]
MKDWRVTLMAAVVVLWAGCASDDGTTSDAGGAGDAGVGGDAAGPSDTGAGGDTGPGAGDALGDTAESPDGAPGDAGSGDAGLDAGPGDAGSTDVLPPEDALADTADGGSPVDTGGPGEDADVGPEPQGPLLGTLEILEQSWTYGEVPAYSTILGQFTEDAPFSFLEPVLEQGGCVVSRFEPGFCDPPCMWGQACSSGGTCKDWAAGASAGKLVVAGLKPGSIELVDYGGGYTYTDILPADLFDATTTVTATAAGADLPPFELVAQGVSSMATSIPDGTLKLSDTTGATLTWEPGAGDVVRIVINAPNQCHGCPYLARVVCDAPDTGSFTIPPAIVKELPPLEAYMICVAHDCPPSWIERSGVGTAPAGKGHVQLRVSSRANFLVEH